MKNENQSARARTWIAVIAVLAGGGLTAKGANDYRLSLERRLTTLESRVKSQDSRVAKNTEWQNEWEKGGELPVDREQNRRLGTLEGFVDKLLKAMAIGTRFTGEDGLVNTGCDDRQNKALLQIMKKLGLDGSQPTIYDDVVLCERVIKELETELKRRRAATP